MKTLKALTLAAAPAMEKVAVRRARLIARLEQQKLLAENPRHVRVVQKWVMQDNGVKAPVDTSIRVRPWWTTDDAGTLYLKVRNGARAIEFEKGKSVIVIKDKTALASTIDTVIGAIKAGELDERLAEKSRPSSRFSGAEAKPV